MKKKIILLLVLAAVGILGWLWYDHNVDRSGFVEENGIRYYQDFHGDRVTGWQEIGENRYYFDEAGAMVTGWTELEGSLHYFGENGALLTGWQDVDGGRYYLDSEGTPLSLWQEIDGSRYYFDPEGVMVTGVVTLDGKTYCFSQTGTIVTGWADGRYYLPDGAMAVGEQEIDGKQHLFHDDGTPYTGWLQEGEYRYYYLEDGSAAVGPTEIDGETWYFTPSGIQVWLVNPWNYLPEDYEVELVTVENGYRIAELCYDALIQMLADCRASGAYPNLCSGYRSYWDQVYMYNAKIAEFGPIRGKQIAAAPNTSEHQLGLAVDILGNKAMAWLQEHCWEYGFILRYTEEKQSITGIIDEPWHFRYVGTEVSMDMKDSGLCLEEYLGAVSTSE